MDELKRYALSSAGRVFPDPDGNWVFHESARAALDSLKAQLATEREAHEKSLAESEARYVAQTDALLKVEREAHARTLAALSSAADMLEVVSCTELFRRYPQDFQARLRASFISFRAAAKVTP